MARLQQSILCISLLVVSWLGMMAIHELGHAMAAHLTGGNVVKVVLHPLTISRTDVRPNPQPLLVVWAGPMFGVSAPLIAWFVAWWAGWRYKYLLRFFAGFCSITNGVYLGFGSFDSVGDAGDMLRLGSPLWSLWLFGIVTVPCGLLLWHRQGRWFGFGDAKGKVDRIAVIGVMVLAILLAVSFCFLGE